MDSVRECFGTSIGICSRVSRSELRQPGGRRVAWLHILGRVSPEYLTGSGLGFCNKSGPANIRKMGDHFLGVL